MVSTQSIARIEDLIQEDHNVKRRRKIFQMQSSLLSKVTRLLSIHDNRSNDSAGSGKRILGSLCGTDVVHVGSTPCPACCSKYCVFLCILFFLCSGTAFVFLCLFCLDSKLSLNITEKQFSLSPRREKNKTR